MACRNVLLCGCLLLSGGWIFAAEPEALPDDLAPHFRVPKKFAGQMGAYSSLLKFHDGKAVRSAADWQKRREEIRKTWHDLMGPWPPLLDKPALENGKKEVGD